ncbi:MAG: type I DNA topoisomerase [Alphaproteobacteria bacterium]|nr:type I DNA topoisomerase [Alphaproteobacteria bacterium]
MNVVVVESPAKAKTINRYLGSDFKVIASYGHVRDLPPKDGSVRPDEDFAMSWQVTGKSQKNMDEITSALRGATHLYLATDPDREGEAISWHVQQILEENKALDGIKVQRVVFHEITKNAIVEAMKHPRELDESLIQAYLARRALDYLVGFTLSPVLWRKLPGSRSAGRVQSVSLRLICEREAEIEIFKADEYWSVDVDLKTAKDQTFTGRLTHLNGKKLNKLSLTDKAAADAALAAVRAAGYKVSGVENRIVRRNPAPPFTTSTLQQEASRKLGFSASQTMQVAQRLYEGTEVDGEATGLITYMRTDSVTLGQEAVAASRALIGQDFGAEYVPATARVYKTKAKNAQEAHEAIRPTNFQLRPAEAARFLDDAQRKLYELIWKRTVASSMESAVLDQMAVNISDPANTVMLRANGSVVKFDGFYILYQESQDEATKDEKDRRLPLMAKDELVTLAEAKAEQHFTQPPPRYTEASLVKKMEELGIGRPSTYASTLKVLQDRDYVRLDKRRFHPEDRGRLVTAFLTNFFKRYVEYDFTAELENQLDEISDGQIDWKKVLRDFWSPFSKSVGGTKDLTITQVLDALDIDLGPHFFPTDENGSDVAARACPACAAGRLNLKLGKFGAFIGCANYPECRYTRQFGAPGDSEEDAEIADLALGPRVLGPHPETTEDVTLRKGPYGLYVQLGEQEPKEKGKKAPPKPKRVSLTKSISPASLSLETALRLLALPREIGDHPETGQKIVAGIGRFGPYLKHGPAYCSVGPEEDILTIGFNRAVVIIAEAKLKGRGGGGRDLGEYDDKPVSVRKGRFGPYVKCGKVNATLPRDLEMDEITLEKAIVLIEAKIVKMEAKAAAPATKAKPKKAAAKKPKAKAKPKAKTKPKAAKKATAKTTTKKTTVKKTPAKKATAKKPTRKKAAATTTPDKADSAVSETT